MSCPFRHLWPAGGAGGANSDAAQGAGAPAVGPAAQAGPASTAAAPGARCPFGHGAAPASTAAAELPCARRAEAAAETAAALAAGELQPPTPSAAAGGQCPFLAGVAGVALDSAGHAATAAALPAGQSDASSSPAADAQHPPAAAPTAAVCPLGFGRSQLGPKLGQFNCLICKSMYYECVVTSCGHRFCAGCMRTCRDCPVCGADVGSLQPDPQTQALVDKYIEAHAGKHTLWELEDVGGGSGQVEGLAGERSRAAFLLQLGLRAIAAGNIESARHRFQMCQEDLQRQLEACLQATDEAHAAAAPATELASLHCRLGAVSGCLGDCCRADGDAGGTFQHYSRSVELLQAAGSDPEAQQALSVSLNKLGELHHLQGDLQAAAGLYAQALQLRRSLLAATQAQAQQEQGQQRELQQQEQGQQQGEQQQQQSAAGQAEAEGLEAGGGWAGEACCSASLDLAASCIKLAGARRELDAAKPEAAALLAEAGALLGGLESGLARQPPRLQRKHASLAQFVQLLSQQ